MKVKFQKEKVVFITLVFSLIILYMSIFVSLYNPNSDVWFMTTIGRFISENGYVPKINYFTIHNDFSFIVQQWIPSLIFYHLYNNFGLYSFYVYSFVMGFISLLIFYKFSGYFTKNNKVRILLLAVICMIISPFLTTRPVLISLSLITLFLCVLEEYKKTKNFKVLLFLPVLSLIEINVHASFWPFLFVVSLPYITPAIPDLKKFNFKQFLLENKYIFFALIISFMFGFFNPNGIKGMLYLFLSYSSAVKGIVISELEKPTFASLFGIEILASIILFVVYIIKNKNELDYKIIYMSLGLIILSTLHIRNLVFLPLFVCPLFCIVFNKFINDVYTPITTRYKILILIYSFIYLLGVFRNINNFKYESEIKDIYYTPVLAVDYLNKLDKSKIVLFTEFNNGAFLQWNGYKVYVDARPELYEKRINGKENIFTEYSNLFNGIYDSKEFLEKYKFTHLVIEDINRFGDQVKYMDDYSLVLKGNGYKLYERKNEN